jgi:catechol 2,3-dioxygenase-like lactoylglutathione lyase family enzyme
MTRFNLRPNRNPEFELRGVNHLALVCKDMSRTVDFYTGVLGMPLVAAIELPSGAGQHFFFDIGGGDMLAFFWFSEGREAAPGIASPRRDCFSSLAGLVTANASMNHVAFDVPAERIEEYREQLLAKGVEVTEVVNHDPDAPNQMTPEPSATTLVRSIYFFDPDGILLEFASWTRELPAGPLVKPAREADRARYLELQRTAESESGAGGSRSAHV